jgi:magnesium chelatase accessory protein
MTAAQPDPARDAAPEPTRDPTRDPPADWPLRAHGRRIRARHDWWVVEHGTGPEVLLLHGAGASGHSFRTLAPALAGYRCLIPDLPGQGFTRAGTRSRFGIDPMAEDLAQLIQAAGWQPRLAIGHSAGVPLALALSRRLPLRAVIGLNAALGQFDGAAGFLFPLLARALAATPFVPALVSRLWGNPAKVRQLIEGTGSTLDPAGIAQYVRLVQRSDHVDGTLGMMAAWRVDRLMAGAAALSVPTLLVANAGDRVVPARISTEAARQLPRAEARILPALGHLSHEEDAAAIRTAIADWLDR